MAAVVSHLKAGLTIEGALDATLNGARFTERQGVRASLAMKHVLDQLEAA